VARHPLCHGTRLFQSDFDLSDHRVALCTSDGAARSLPLEPQPVASFYRKVMAALDELGVRGNSLGSSALTCCRACRTTTTASGRSP
jgi:hypothetical protein